MPPIETATLGYKVASLLWEVFKAFRNSSQAWYHKAEYKMVSSLTTLEFVQEATGQVAHYVQDRSIVFIRDKVRLPPFVFRTEGKDFIDALIVDDIPRKFRVTKPPELGQAPFVEPEEDIVYDKGQKARAILLARSIDGYPNQEETFGINVRFSVDSTSLAIVFPAEKKPVTIEMRYQEPGESPSTWRAVRGEMPELRHTTRNRLVYVWEAKHLKYGRKYRIQWKW